jgi:hypothetical protein
VSGRRKKILLKIFQIKNPKAGTTSRSLITGYVLENGSCRVSKYPALWVVLKTRYILE